LQVGDVTHCELTDISTPDEGGNAIGLDEVGPNARLLKTDIQLQGMPAKASSVLRDILKSR
jgi:hypothetical protein